ncbi:hypothetical protein [Wenzhouxiangella marina]|nr:hypothetical protein [Wenzhouxiangella marina]MBB6088095.1 hypothetical protein [Wenzhouxiangella marina]
MTRSESSPVEKPWRASDDLFERLRELGFQKHTRFASLIWEGAFEGRRTSLTISRQTRTRYQGRTRRRAHLGWRLRIEMECRVMTRLYFVKESVTRWRLLRWLYRLKKQSVIEDLPSVLEGFDVVAADETWGLTLIEDWASMLNVASLLTERSSEQLRGSVYFQPERLHYGSGLLQVSDMDATWIESVLRRAARIAEGAEGLPDPTVQSAPTRLERLSRKQPLLAGALVLSAVLGGLAIMTLTGLSLVLALAWGLSRL